mmetsp:Transcript_22095/g.67879  ORF Transcript_22095/g.67879 Transcript_22095/m.67879 type:complete len:433 (+) Transcript_22095:2065-3363(+)
MLLVKVRRHEDVEQQRELLALLDGGPLVEVRVAPEVVLMQAVVRAGARAVDAHAHAAHAQRRIVVVARERARRVLQRLDAEVDLVVRHDAHVLVHGARDHLQPLLHVLVVGGAERPVALDGHDVKGVLRRVLLLRHRPDERHLAEVDLVALVPLGVEERAVAHVRVVRQEVALARLKEHKVAVQPLLRRAAALQQPALVHHDLVPVLHHVGAHGRHGLRARPAVAEERRAPRPRRGAVQGLAARRAAGAAAVVRGRALHDVAIEVHDLEVADGRRRRRLLALQRVALEHVAAVGAADHGGKAPGQPVAVPKELHGGARVADLRHGDGKEVAAHGGRHIQTNPTLRRVDAVTHVHVLHVLPKEQQKHRHDAAAERDGEPFVVHLELRPAASDGVREAARALRAHGLQRHRHAARVDVVQRVLDAPLGARHDGL